MTDVISSAKFSQIISEFLIQAFVFNYGSTEYLKSIFEMIMNGLLFSCARGWTKRKITPGGVYKIITERIKEIKKKSVPWLILVLCQITTLFGADYCSKVRLNSRLKARTKVLLIKSCNGLFLGNIILYLCLFRACKFSVLLATCLLLFPG